MKMLRIKLIFAFAILITCSCSINSCPPKMEKKDIEKEPNSEKDDLIASSIKENSDTINQFFDQIFDKNGIIIESSEFVRNLIATSNFIFHQNPTIILDNHPKEVIIDSIKCQNKNCAADLAYPKLIFWINYEDKSYSFCEKCFCLNKYMEVNSDIIINNTGSTNLTNIKFSENEDDGFDYEYTFDGSPLLSIAIKCLYDFYQYTLCYSKKEPLDKSEFLLSEPDINYLIKLLQIPQQHSNVLPYVLILGTLSRFSHFLFSIHDTLQKIQKEEILKKSITILGKIRSLNENFFKTNSVIEQIDTLQDFYNKISRKYLMNSSIMFQEFKSKIVKELRTEKFSCQFLSTIFSKESEDNLSKLNNNEADGVYVNLNHILPVLAKEFTDIQTVISINFNYFNQESLHIQAAIRNMLKLGLLTCMKKLPSNYSAKTLSSLFDLIYLEKEEKCIFPKAKVLLTDFDLYYINNEYKILYSIASECCTFFNLILKKFLEGTDISTLIKDTIKQVYEERQLQGVWASLPPEIALTQPSIKKEENSSNNKKKEESLLWQLYKKFVF